MQAINQLALRGYTSHPTQQAEIQLPKKSGRRPENIAHHAAKRRANLKSGTPPWADNKAIEAKYKEAAELTKKTGVIHHVDHVIPLTNHKVCGLHVETNLQVIPATENIRKRNSFGSEE